MLSLSPAVRIFVHALPTDMRKHFDGLSSIVTHSFGMDVLCGDYFVFLNRARNRCKILLWDRDGLVVWAKRLERGCFQIARRPGRRFAGDRNRFRDAGDDDRRRGSQHRQASQALSGGGRIGAFALRHAMSQRLAHRRRNRVGARAFLLLTFFARRR